MGDLRVDQACAPCTYDIALTQECILTNLLGCVSDRGLTQALDIMSGYAYRTELYAPDERAENGERSLSFAIGLSVGRQSYKVLLHCLQWLLRGRCQTHGL
jgi:hypothetical protein